MTFSLRPLQILFLAIALATSLLSGCAHDPDKDRPWKKNKPKWYDSDMDSSERSFFLGSFFDHGR